MLTGPPPKFHGTRDILDLDWLALLAVNDIEDYWKRNYSDALPGSFTAVSCLLSYDSNDPSSPAVLCGETYGLINAFYCPNLVRTRRLRSQTRQDRHPHSMKPTPEPHPAATPPTIIAATKAFSGRSS
jgi:hypothetical protein